MSKSLSNLQKHNGTTKNAIETNKLWEHQQTKTFTSWYKQMVDNERQNLALYLSDDVILQWFGRTIKTRKKVSSFFKHDMECSRHDFVNVTYIDKIQNRHENHSRKEENDTHHSPELERYKTDRRKRILRSNYSPEWAEGCQPVEELESTNSKRLKANHTKTISIEPKLDNCYQKNGVKRGFDGDDSIDVNNKGDGILNRRVKRKLIPVTPPNAEVGQGDCMPSTSAGSDQSHEALNAQLPKLFVECNGYIEFCRTRNNSVEGMKWNRKCKVQISYSVDPLNVGEYIIWGIHYTDESKCRRNLLSAFEEVAKHEKEKK